jgi:hypothetical protein
MSFDGKGLFKSVGLVVVLLAFAPALATAQEKPVVANQAILSMYLDKNGGYRDQEGGYFNPKAGTYTDDEGGVVDNWKGYTYKDGSYKSKDGDFYDARKRLLMLTTGENLPAPQGATNAEMIEIMRESVAERGGFDKDFVRKSMFATILKEHRVDAPAPKPKGR